MEFGIGLARIKMARIAAVSLSLQRQHPTSDASRPHDETYRAIIITDHSVIRVGAYNRCVDMTLPALCRHVSGKLISISYTAGSHSV